LCEKPVSLGNYMTGHLRICTPANNKANGLTTNHFLLDSSNQNRRSSVFAETIDSKQDETNNLIGVQSCLTNQWNSIRLKTVTRLLRSDFLVKLTVAVLSSGNETLPLRQIIPSATSRIWVSPASHFWYYSFIFDLLIQILGRGPAVVFPRNFSTPPSLRRGRVAPHPPSPLYFIFRLRIE